MKKKKNKSQEVELTVVAESRHLGLDTEKPFVKIYIWGYPENLRHFAVAADGDGDYEEIDITIDRAIEIAGQLLENESFIDWNSSGIEEDAFVE